MESHKELKADAEQIKKHYVTYRHLDAVIPALQKTLDEVRADIKQLLIVVHNNAKKRTEPN